MSAMRATATAGASTSDGIGSRRCQTAARATAGVLRNFHPFRDERVPVWLADEVVVDRGVEILPDHLAVPVPARAGVWRFRPGAGCATRTVAVADRMASGAAAAGWRRCTA